MAVWFVIMSPNPDNLLQNCFNLLLIFIVFLISPGFGAFTIRYN